MELDLYPLEALGLNTEPHGRLRGSFQRVVLVTESLYGQMELNRKVEVGEARTSVDPSGALWCIKTWDCAMSSLGEEITASFRLLIKGLPWGRANP